MTFHVFLHCQTLLDKVWLQDFGRTLLPTRLIYVTLAMGDEILLFRAMMWCEALRSTQSMAANLLISHWFYGEK